MDNKTEQAIDKLLGEGRGELKPWEMPRDYFLSKSEEYYDKYGNTAWIASKFHTDVSQETHN